MQNITNLDHFGFLLVEGKDALSFLQGYTTCDLEQLLTNDTNSQGLIVSSIGATCNIKGRMVSSYRAISTENGFLLRMPKELVSVTQSFLQKYIVFSKASMTDVTNEMVCQGILGDVPIISGIISNETQGVSPGFLVETESEYRAEYWHTKALSPSQELEEVSPKRWQLAEISDCIGWIDGNTTEKFIPQMLNYHNLAGIDFEKGCYLGQEIVARMQYRGELKRKLHKAKAIAKSVPDSGTEIVDESGKNVGEIITCVEQNDELKLLAVLKEDSSNYLLATGEPLTLLS